MPTTEITDLVPAGPGRNWLMYKGDTSHTAYTDEHLNFPLKLAWKQAAAMSTDEIGKQNPSSPVVENGVVYFAAGRRLYAANADTGALRWYYPVAETLTSTVKSTPLVGEDLVYFGAGDGRVYAIKKDTGELAWTFITKGIVNSSPTLENGILYIGSGDDHLYAIDARTGEAKWPGGFRTRDDVASSPAIADGLVFFLSSDMILYAAYTGTGKVKWAMPVGATSRNSSPVVAENTVYMASGNYLQAFQAKSGRLVWGLPLKTTITCTPAYARGVLYFGGVDGRIYAFTSAGKLKWSTPVDIGTKSYGSPVVADDTVIVGANKGTLVALDTETGALKWSYTITPSALDTGVARDYVNIVASPVVSDGTLYVLSDDGVLYAFRYDMPDNTPPLVSRVTPPRGYTMSGSPPVQIAAVFSDPGSGVRPDTISLSLDGESVEYQLLAERGIIYYNTPMTQPVVPLENGMHTASLSMADWAGNKTEMTWSFVVDDRMPKRATTQQNTDTTGGKRSTGPANP